MNKKAVLALAIGAAVGAVFAAPGDFVVTWDPYPAPPGVIVTMEAQCQVNGGPFRVVGTAPSTDRVIFTPGPSTIEVRPGDRIACRASATAPGFPETALSGVGAVYVVPLSAATNVRVAPF